MSHNYLVIKTEWIPEWTKQNVKTYSLARFNNDGSKLLLDNAHPVSTYLKWIGSAPNAEDVLQQMLFMSDCVTASQVKSMELDPESDWFIGVSE